MKNTILLSVFIHALSFLFFFKTAKDNQDHSAKPTEIEVVINDVGSSQKHSPPRGSSASAQPIKTYNLGLTTRTDSKNLSAGQTAKSEKPDGYQVARSMDINAASQLEPFFQKIWQKVDSATGYPDVFVQRRIEGGVTIQLEVGRDGVFTGRFLQIESDDTLLKTYVTAVLVNALDEPLPKNAWSDRETMPIVFRFDFEVFTSGVTPKERKFEHFKNILSFKRKVYDDPILKKFIDKIMTKYIPPIIPIPGGAYIDFIRAYKMIEDMGKIDENDLLSARLQSMKEKWRSVIRKKTGVAD